MCNMKAQSLLVRKLWPRLKFFVHPHADTETRAMTLAPRLANKKVMAKVAVYQKYIEVQGQGHKVVLS